MAGGQRNKKFGVLLVSPLLLYGEGRQLRGIESFHAPYAALHLTLLLPIPQSGEKTSIITPHPLFCRLIDFKRVARLHSRGRI